jgi:3-hydroxyisobutyrate dehydrogenase
MAPPRGVRVAKDRAPGKHRIGWIGAGRMGSEMAARLLDAGCSLSVYNRTRAKAEPLEAKGAQIAESPAALARHDIVFTTVGSPQDLIDVITGPDGLLSGDAAPAVLVDCSTVSAEASGRIREEAAARGTALLAAPVSGNPGVARSGRLTMAVSGPRSAYDDVAPYLDLLGAGTTYVGEGELARTVKLCHNLLLGVLTQSMAEVTVLAEKSGVSRQAFLGFLNQSVVGSLFSTYKTPAFVNLDFRPTFTATLLRKDFDLGLAAARELEVPLPVSALVHEIIQSLIGHGHGESDFAALLQLQAESANLPLESEHADVPDGLDQ